MAGQTAQKLSDVFFAIPAGQFARHLPSPCYFATPCPAFYLNFHPRFPLFLSRATIYNIFPRLPPLLPANPLVSRNNNAPRVTKIFRFRATGNGSCVRAPFFVFWNNAVTVLGSSTSLCYSLCVTESVKNAAKSVILRVLIYRNTPCCYLISLFSTTRFHVSVDSGDKLASSHFSNYITLFLWNVFAQSPFRNVGRKNAGKKSNRFWTWLFRFFPVLRELSRQ